MADGKFLALENGRVYLRVNEVAKVAWESMCGDRSTDPKSWRLKLFDAEGRWTILHGEDAALALEALGLPTEPPDA